MKRLELNQNELILLRKIIVFYNEQLAIKSISIDEDILEELGNKAIQEINKSTVNHLLVKIDKTINNQNS